jgi:hypothetical protein
MFTELTASLSSRTTCCIRSEVISGFRPSEYKSDFAKKKNKNGMAMQGFEPRFLACGAGTSTHVGSGLTDYGPQITATRPYECLKTTIDDIASEFGGLTEVFY